MTTCLHEQRLQAVQRIVNSLRPRTVLDLGCGPGPLLQRLAANDMHDRIVGVDLDRKALDRLRTALSASAAQTAPAVEIVQADVANLQGVYHGFDLALLIEAIEHMTIGALKSVSNAVFSELRPRNVIVTTPNIEFNHLLGVPSRRLRHPGHRFEWTREEFGAWSAAIAGQFSYGVHRRDICGAHPRHGGATQLALFTLEPAHTK